MNELLAPAMVATTIAATVVDLLPLGTRPFNPGAVHDQAHHPSQCVGIRRRCHKALFLRNAGDEKSPNLTTERVFVDENPPADEQGTDRSGRGFRRAMTNRRSSMETTDWHELEKHRFAQRVADAMEQLMRAGNVRALIVAAPPRTLAELRHAFRPDVQKHIIAEIDKDLTKHPISEIERHIFG